MPWGLRRRLHCFLFHLLTFVLSWESSSKRKLERSESFGEFLLLPFSSMTGTLYSHHSLTFFSSHLHVVVLMKGTTAIWATSGKGGTVSLRGKRRTSRLEAADVGKRTQNGLSLHLGLPRCI